MRGVHAAITGLGSYLPSIEVTNAMLCEKIDSSDEWIRSRTGIRTRYWATPEETVEHMAIEAAKDAIKHAGITASEVGCVVVSTVSHLRQFPSLASGVAHGVGADDAGAFDISAGCAGFCYGLQLASGMIAAQDAQHVLVIAVERLSELVDQEDRNTSFLFGDGASAAVVSASDEPGIGPVVWGSDGSQKDTIRQSVSWADLQTDRDAWPVITMDGREVFRWAAYEMGPAAKKTLERAGVTAQDLDAFIPHQANLRITDELVKGLDLPERVVVARTITEHGNTSAVSVPLAMHQLLATGEAPAGGLALLLSFGTGLVWAGQVVRLPPAPPKAPTKAEGAIA
ncbi:3-oxoacyl-[acyl-carrier-protein] synthase 3 protein 1 [Lentzea sp. NBRC 105346]|uniref:beta-ketoacyl-ACP synthase III n=1 Tax=Lentzea sp. NBRC 105346 TaxID=3032205 RepID=UPI0024A1F1B4|nr:beta-ketoacyl-ACP synthase III [Lentzea sp. NBRC 105346]GLZ32257.1 3-oxoacyl-[acyl-carrier-protein] synthase 3 protein 1 [Lentzea sp. NBRC 105346]